MRFHKMHAGVQALLVAGKRGLIEKLLNWKQRSFLKF